MKNWKQMDYNNDFEETLHGLDILESTLPSVFSSQSSNNSETPILSPHDISEFCDRDCSVYWSTDDLKNETNLDYNSTMIQINYEYEIFPPHFENSSLAYSPISNPPKSPPEEISTVTNYIPESPAFFSDTDDDCLFDVYDIIKKEGFPIIPDQTLDLYLDFSQPNQEINRDNTSMNVTINQAHFSDTNIDNTFSDSNKDDTISFSIENTSEFLYSINNETMLDDNNNNIEKDRLTKNSICFDVINKPTIEVANKTINNTDNNNIIIYGSENRVNIGPAKSGRGRKRKLNCNKELQSNKKKCQNKEAARRYRDKKKIEEKQLEDEEKELMELVRKKRKAIKELETQHKFYLEITQEFLERKGIRVTGLKR